MRSFGFVVIGTDHRMQNGEPGFEGLLRGLLGQRYFEPLTAVAEEYGNALGTSCAERLAREHNLRWFNLDMTTEEKWKAGILEDQLNRPGMFQEGTTRRVASDEIRERAWVEKLEKLATGTTLIICGYLHFEPLVQKLRTSGHCVDKRVYLETVPTITLPEAKED